MAHRAEMATRTVTSVGRPGNQGGTRTKRATSGASPTVRYHRPRRTMARIVKRLLAAALLAAIFFATAALVKSSAIATLMARVDDMLIAGGLGLDTITVSGQRYTADGDVFDCLELGEVRTLVAVESLRAKTCIEALPWVAQAALQRVYPGRLDVSLTERVPFAIWHNAGRTVLIDAAGRVLSAVPDDYAAPGLVRIAGVGAPEAASALVDMLAHHPAIARRLDQATRVAGRRWSLALLGNISIELPAEGEATALSDLATRPGGDRLLTGSDIAIDLRSRFEIATRPKPPPHLSSRAGG